MSNVSRTAEGAAALRASHFLHDEEPVFKDPYAFKLTNALWRVICGSRLLHWLVLRRALSFLRPVYGNVVGRSRYVEDELDRAVAAGCRQYVIIGAGFDSFALRRPDLADRLRVYEIDLPGTQEVKRRKFKALGKPVPPHVEQVPVDLEHETVADALARSSYVRGEVGFFSWLGASYFLTEDAVRKTLSSVAQFAAPGSTLIFDYLIPLELVEPKDLPMVEKLLTFTASSGERHKVGFDPRVFPGEVCRLGYELVANVGREQLDEWYFARRRDDLRAPPGAFIGHFRVAAS